MPGGRPVERRPPANLDHFALAGWIRDPSWCLLARNHTCHLLRWWQGIHVATIGYNLLTVSRDYVKFRYDLANSGVCQVGHNMHAGHNGAGDVELKPNDFHLSCKKDMHHAARVGKFVGDITCPEGVKCATAFRVNSQDCRRSSRRKLTQWS